MTDRNAKPFTLIIFGLMFSILIISQIVIKSKYETLLQHELGDFTETYISYTESINQKICYYLNTFFAFENAPSSAYTKMLEASVNSLSEIDAAYIFLDSGEKIWSSNKEINLDISSIDSERIIKDTNDTMGICITYANDGNVYYSKRFFSRSGQVGVVCLQVSYDRIIRMLDEVFNKFSWLDIIVKDKYNKVIYITRDRLEKNVDDELYELFQKADEQINEGDIDILYETNTSKKTSNKEKIGKYNFKVNNGNASKEIARRHKQISATAMGDKLQLSITAISSLNAIDPNYDSRLIIMLVLLVLILIVHLIAGFFIPDESMTLEFSICLVLFIFIFFMNCVLEIGFLNNIYDNELDCYSKLISKINNYDDEWTGLFSESVADTFTIQDIYMNGPGYNFDVINGIGRQVIIENESITSIAILENGKTVFSYPQDFDAAQYATEIKDSMNLVVQKTYYDKSKNTAIVLTKMRFKYNPDAIMLSEFKISNGSALADSEKFSVFGFRDAYGDAKLLDLKTNEAVDSFVEKVVFDEKTECVTGIKYIDGKLYGYIMIPNSSNNINVYRYELENLYNYLAIYFIIAMIFIILITYYGLKVYRGRSKNKTAQKEDEVYNKLIEKIDQDIADYGDDTID